MRTVIDYEKPGALADFGASDGATLVLALNESQIEPLPAGGGGPGDARHPPPHRQVGRGRGGRAQAGHRLDPDFAAGPAGPGAGQGADRHHRAARVPDGGRHDRRFFTRRYQTNPPPPASRTSR